MTSATIKLFLPRGDAKSLRTAEISNWTGKAVAAPRTELDELLAREELDKTGVYILIGSDPLTNAPRAYIGEAEYQRTANGFVVFQGFTAVLEERPSAEIYPYAVAQRKQLIADGTLIDKDGFLVFTKDAEFSSPSAAAAVIHGGSANGLIAWKTEGGKSLKQLDEQA
jgi:predicted type IV restriction endonuclease